MPSPATVAMVFEGGQEKAPALPNPPFLGPIMPAPTPPAAPAAPQAAAPPPAPPPPPPQPAPQTEAAPLPPAPPPAAEKTPAPAPPPPPAPAATAELPLPPPPPPLAMVVPRPPTPAPSSPPAPRHEAPAPRRAPAFPEPMNYSFGPVQPPSRAPSRAASRAMPNTLDMALAPRRGEATDTSSIFSRIAGAHVGPDWGNELIAWVKAHSYYPPQAAMNGEDGDVVVQVVANPDGRVTSVELVGRSGSQWLDMALMGLFRGAHLPPLPDDQRESITFNFMMHYILIRGR